VAYRYTLAHYPEDSPAFPPVDPRLVAGRAAVVSAGTTIADAEWGHQVARVIDLAVVGVALVEDREVLQVLPEAQAVMGLAQALVEVADQNGTPDAA